MVVNDGESSLRDLAKEARDGKLTYYSIMCQLEDDDYVNWEASYGGVKSYDPAHLLTELGNYYVISQAVFQELLEVDVYDED